MSDEMEPKPESVDEGIKKLKEMLKAKRQALGVDYWPGAPGIESELLSIFRVYDNNLAHAKDNVDKYLEHILAALYGIRFIANAILNETWTHQQKNAQILAMGAMVETAIKRIKDDRHEIATSWRLDDPFTPSWSRDGIHRRATDAEAKVQELGEKLRVLEERLIENGIDPTVNPIYSDDSSEGDTF
jgi:hypothetical protein